MRPLFKRLEKELEERRNKPDYYDRIIRNLNDKSGRILRGDYRTVEQSITNVNYGSGIMTNKIVIVNSTDGDWSGLFVNDSLNHEGHSISEHELLSVLHKNQPFEYEVLEVESEWLNEGGCFPNKFSDIPKEQFV